MVAGGQRGAPRCPNNCSTPASPGNCSPWEASSHSSAATGAPSSTARSQRRRRRDRPVARTLRRARAHQAVVPSTADDESTPALDLPAVPLAHRLENHRPSAKRADHCNARAGLPRLLVRSDDQPDGHRHHQATACGPSPPPSAGVSFDPPTRPCRRHAQGEPRTAGGEHIGARCGGHRQPATSSTAPCSRHEHGTPEGPHERPRSREEDS